MVPGERAQLVATSLIFAAWVVMIMEAWASLVARLSTPLWIAAVCIHGGALLGAIRLYLRSRKPPAVPSREVLAVLSLWMMTWAFDFSIIGKLGR